jgi:hypothetical protein
MRLLGNRYNLRADDWQATGLGLLLGLGHRRGLESLLGRMLVLAVRGLLDECGSCGVDGVVNGLGRLRIVAIRVVCCQVGLLGLAKLLVQAGMLGLGLLLRLRYLLSSPPGWRWLGSGSRRDLGWVDRRLDAGSKWCSRLLRRPLLLQLVPPKAQNGSRYTKGMAAWRP